MKVVIWSILLAVTNSLAAQQGGKTVESEEIKQKRLEYQRAYKVWRESDPILEKDMATIPQPLLLARIKDADKNAHSYFEQKLEYLNLLASDYGRRRAALVENTSDQATHEDILDSIKKQQNSLVQQIGRLNREIEALAADPNKERGLLREAAERQRTALLTIQNNLVEQLSGLEEGKKLGERRGVSTRGTADRYNQMIARVKKESETIAIEKELWNAYYRSLWNSFAQPSPSAPVSSGPVNVKQVEPTDTRWLGTWVYDASEPNSYFGNQPDSVVLRITVYKGMLHGTYHAIYKPGNGVDENSKVDFEFSGVAKDSPEQKFALQWQNRMTGFIELKSIDSRSLEVIWTKTSEGDGLRFGNEVLYKR